MTKTRVGEKHATRVDKFDSLCCKSGLLLSIVCCIALIRVELRVQEHHQLISHSVTLVVSWKHKSLELNRKMEDGKSPKAAIQIWDKRWKVSIEKNESKDRWSQLASVRNKVNHSRPTVKDI